MDYHNNCSMTMITCVERKYNPDPDQAQIGSLLVEYQWRPHFHVPSSFLVNFSMIFFFKWIDPTLVLCYRFVPSIFEDLKFPCRLPPYLLKFISSINTKWVQAQTNKDQYGQHTMQPTPLRNKRLYVIKKWLCMYWNWKWEGNLGSDKWRAKSLTSVRTSAGGRLGFWIKQKKKVRDLNKISIDKHHGHKEIFNGYLCELCSFQRRPRL